MGAARALVDLAARRPGPGSGRSRTGSAMAAHLGPAPASDLQWWAGWTVTQTKRALAATDAVEIEVEVAEGEFEAGHVLPETMAVLDQSSASPWIALLPALDPTSMGWKHRDWYLGPHRDHFFDRSGNIGPTIWADGRVVGAWAQRADGEIVTQLLEELGADQRSAVAARAQELEAWLGPLRFKPRFPTPLERSLRS
ncbi:MAG: crosslink repair DNA glycosylase YcaQ family protein [Ilumatobacteraceae bacterium]